MDPKSVIKWTSSVALGIFLLGLAVVLVGGLGLTAWHVTKNGKLPSFTSPAAEKVTTTPATVVITNVVSATAAMPVDDSDVITEIEPGHFRRDTSGKPELTEWANLARKVDADVPDWVVPVQVIKGVPYLVLSKEPGKEPRVIAPDGYKDLYRWHQVTVAEAGAMDIIYGTPEKAYTLVGSTLRFMGKVWVLERIPPKEPEPPLEDADPPGTATVTAKPEAP